MEPPTTDNPGGNDESRDLPLPRIRCLTKEQAAAYLGIGVTLLAGLQVPTVKFGRRCVYDVVDLDAWLTEYKHRGRAGKETLWPVRKESTDGETRATGGSASYYPAANEYAKVLGLKTERTRKPLSPS
jgi:hypothetical protein